MFFLWSPEGAEEQVEHDEAELEAGDNVEASGELILSSSQLHSSHWTATEFVTAVTTDISAVVSWLATEPAEIFSAAAGQLISADLADSNSVSQIWFLRFTCL